MTDEEATLVVEALRAYRMRIPVLDTQRKQLSEDLIIRLISQLTKEEANDRIADCPTQ